MLRITFADKLSDYKVSDRIKEMVQTTIEVAANILDIGNHNNAVEVAFLVSKRNTKGATATNSIDPILMSFSKAKPIDMVPTICHEMFHVRDLVLGNLTTESGKQYYRGVLIPDADLQLAKKLSDVDFSRTLLPDEAVAYAGMYPLATQVMKELPSNIREFILLSASSQDYNKAAEIIVNGLGANAGKLKSLIERVKKQGQLKTPQDQKIAASLEAALDKVTTH